MILPTHKFNTYADVDEWLKSLDCPEIASDDFYKEKNKVQPQVQPQVSRYMLQKQLKVCSFTYPKASKSWMFFIPVKVTDGKGITHNKSLYFYNIHIHLFGQICEFGSWNLNGNDVLRGRPITIDMWNEVIIPLLDESRDYSITKKGLTLVPDDIFLMMSGDFAELKKKEEQN